MCIPATCALGRTEGTRDAERRVQQQSEMRRTFWVVAKSLWNGKKAKIRLDGAELVWFLRGGGRQSGRRYGVPARAR